MRPRRLALIGYGAIGGDLTRNLLAAIDPSFVVGVWLAAHSPSRGKVPPGCALISDGAELDAFAPDLVVEAAGHGAVRDLVPACLERGLPVLITSIGALHDEALFARLVATARDHRGRLLLPSGALGGLDYLRAARGAGDLKLRYQSRKPVAAWADEILRLGHDPAEIAAPVTLFSGDARAAAAAYPANLNVAAALALAGPGFPEVEVEIVCDPAATGNTHAVTAESAFGTMAITIANRPSPDNPKTSAIVAGSLMAAIEQYFSPVSML